MLVIEIMVPKGVLSGPRRRALAGRLTAARLLSGDGGDAHADPGVLAWFESLTHVIVREEEVWIADGVLQDPDSSPRYVVNVYVGAWGKEMSEHLISRITTAIAQGEDDPVRLTREPHALVHVISAAEGGYGFLGRACRGNDALQMIELAKTGTRLAAPPGMAIDPVCGAQIPLGQAVLLEHEGDTYGFCCTHCRGRFVKRLREARQSR